MDKAGRGGVRGPSRRAFLLGGVVLGAQAAIGCVPTAPSDLESIFVAVSALASSGVFDLAMLENLLGDLSFSAYAKTSQANPKAFTALYQAEAHQGQGMVTVQTFDYNEPDLPLVGNGDAVSTLSADGPNFVVTTNPTDDPVVDVTLIDEQGIASNVNGNDEGYLNYLPDLWLPGAGLYLLGLRQATYVRMECLTDNGELIGIDLV